MWPGYRFASVMETPGNRRGNVGGMHHDVARSQSGANGAPEARRRRDGSHAENGPPARDMTHCTTRRASSKPRASGRRIGAARRVQPGTPATSASKARVSRSTRAWNAASCARAEPRIGSPRSSKYTPVAGARSVSSRVIMRAARSGVLR